MSMKERLHELKWYIKVAIHFGKLSLQSVMEYPLNFVSGICVELAYMMIKLVYLYVVLSTGMNVGSLTPDMVVIFVGTYIFMTGILQSFHPPVIKTVPITTLGNASAKLYLPKVCKN